jgi:hypothetical protein
MNSGDKTICVFWDFETMMWSTKGCNLVSTNPRNDYSICECSHLGNFAAILDMSERMKVNWIDALINRNITGINDVIDSIVDIENNITNNFLSSFRELEIIVDFLANLQDFLILDKTILNFTEAFKIKNDFVRLSNILINQNNVWINTTAQEKTETASKLLQLIENSAFMPCFNKSHSNYTREFETENIFEQTYPKESKKNIFFQFNGSSISVPVKNDSYVNKECFTFGVGYLIKQVGKYISVNFDKKVNTEIISFVIGNANESRQIVDNTDLKIR